MVILCARSSPIVPGRARPRRTGARPPPPPPEPMRRRLLARLLPAALRLAERLAPSGQAELSVPSVRPGLAPAGARCRLTRAGLVRRACCGACAVGVVAFAVEVRRGFVRSL